VVKERMQVRKKRTKQRVSLERQLALGLLQDAMSKVEKGPTRPEEGYSMNTPSGAAHVVAIGVPGGPEIVEYVDVEHPIRQPLPVLIRP
jgi:hypothetical protein